MQLIDPTPFLRLRKHLTIAHHVPGRIRLRISPAVFKDMGKVDSSLFNRILDALPGIESVRLNATAGSVVISYRPALIEPTWWETLITGEEHQATALLQRLITRELAPAMATLRDAEDSLSTNTPASTRSIK